MIVARHSAAMCAYCDGPADTQDHILPRAWGAVPRNIRNKRPACRRCNLFRSVCGHCPAAMSTARAVVGDPPRAHHRDEITLARLWGWCGERSQARAAQSYGRGADLSVIRAIWPPMAIPAQEIRPQPRTQGVT